MYRLHLLRFLHLSTLELSYVTQYGYAAFFFIFMAGEVLGFLPLGLFLVAMGALARQHLFSFPILLMLAIAASVSGNLIVYSIARKIGKQRIYQERIKDSRLATRIEEHMDAHPLLTIFATRFIGIACYPTTLIAGLVGVPRRTFALAVALGNGLCCLVYLMVGYFVGGAWESDARTASRIGLVIVLLVLIGYIIYYLAGKLRDHYRHP